MKNKPQIFFLTYTKLPLLPPSEIDVISRLRNLGYNVKIHFWDSWDFSDLVENDFIFLRSTWDYDQKPMQFKKFLSELKQKKVFVFNDIDLMLWNMNKSYMFEFQEKKLAIVPTYKPSEKAKLVQNHPNCTKVITKPIFSAGARGLKQLSLEEWLNNDLSESEYICQPYLASVAKSGEWSLLYFNGIFSHAVLKRAKQGDFRVQSDHGGTVESAEVSQEWILLGKTFLDACKTKPFFARVDLVLWENNPVLIELEIIEPELFVTEKAANQNYVDAIISKIEMVSKV